MELEDDSLDFDECYVCGAGFKLWSGGTRIEVPSEDSYWSSTYYLCVDCTVTHVLPGITQSIES
jgi:hypothetical protein